ncbi:MAG: fasciclin domain-containing protein [Reichenbachiella sp.]|uniref:fasciclin domain-containing protein n=1 Tax=Reichenbachiella sp. TaxID=2184521 RepID=UPI003296B38D
MKTRLFSKLLLAIMVFATIGCNNKNIESNSVAVEEPESAASHPKGQASVEDNVSEANILQVAIGSEAHSTLVAAVQAAEIEHVLVNAGPLTVFAPTNDAFAALPEGTVDDLLKPENKSKLANILTGHAAPGSYDIEALKKEARKGRKIYTATGQYLEVTVEGDDVFIAGSKILGTIQTTNGVINVVDKIIL